MTWEAEKRGSTTDPTEYCVPELSKARGSEIGIPGHHWHQPSESPPQAMGSRLLLSSLS